MDHAFAILLGSVAAVLATGKVLAVVQAYELEQAVVVPTAHHLLVLVPVPVLVLVLVLVQQRHLDQQ